MGGLFNTLNKSLPGRSFRWKDNSCVVHCLYSQLRCIRTFRKMFSCLRRSDRRRHVDQNDEPQFMQPPLTTSPLLVSRRSIVYNVAVAALNKIVHRNSCRTLDVVITAEHPKGLCLSPCTNVVSQLKTFWLYTRISMGLK